MTIEQLKAAYAAGETIQISWPLRDVPPRFLFDSEWTDLANPQFDSPVANYRIKPKEKTL